MPYCNLRANGVALAIGNGSGEIPYFELYACLRSLYPKILDTNNFPNLVRKRNFSEPGLVKILESDSITR
jgi:hypothetical protein